MIAGKVQSPLNHLPLAALALCFFRFGVAGIWTCASAVTASSKLSGYRDTGAPRRPAGLRGFLDFACCGMGGMLTQDQRLCQPFNGSISH